MIGDALVLASLGIEPVRPGNSHMSMAPHGVYPTREPDRWLTLAVRNDEEWHALVRELEQPAAVCRPSVLPLPTLACVTPPSSTPCSSKWLANASADSLAERLQRAGVCAHVSWNTADIARDPHLRDRGVTREVSGPDIPTRVAVGAPVRFSKTTDVGIRRLTPALGKMKTMSSASCSVSARPNAPTSNSAKSFFKLRGIAK